MNSTWKAPQTGINFTGATSAAAHRILSAFRRKCLSICHGFGVTAEVRPDADDEPFHFCDLQLCDAVRIA